MHHRWPLTFTIVAVAIVATNGEHNHQRKLHRLVGGHLKIHHPESDDSELMLTASAGEPKDKKSNGKGGEEDKKTLSQQVAEGKYGLIQKELFKKPPKRPGILSYETNPEVPKDNINTLGGLSKNEIWLAENHLLVIRGGTYPPHDDIKDYPGSIWQPIDDYSAPLHQVKIPKNPKVPPPFPVQFADDGPLQILGTNFTRTLNGSAEAEAYALPPPGLGWEDEEGQSYEATQGSADTDSTNPPAGQAPVRVPSQSGDDERRPGEYNGGLPLPPSLASNGTWPAFFESLPPGAVIVTPPAPQENGTEVPFDEDDPSIYYPPPYSFYYPKDNSSVVPPGPLVPGIVLPPPPNFFAQLEETTTHPPTTTTTFITTITPKRKTHKEDVPVINKVRNKAIKSGVITTKVPKYSTVSSVRFIETRRNRTKERTHYRGRPMAATVTSTTKRPNVQVISTISIGTNAINRTYLPQKVVKPTKLKPTVTILRPVKPKTSTPKVVIYNNADDVSNNQNGEVEQDNKPINNLRPVKPKTSIPKVVIYNNADDITNNQNSEAEQDNQPINKPFATYGLPKENPYGPLPIDNEVYEPPVSLKPVISTSRVPLKYYTSSPVAANLVTESPEDGAIDINSYIPKVTPKAPTQYYFFEEEPEKSRVTTQKPQVVTSSYFKTKNYGYSDVRTSEKPVVYYPSVQTTESPNVYYSSGQTTEGPSAYYPQTTKKPQFIYVNSKPTQKPRYRLVQQPPRLNTFSIHIAKLQNELQQYYTTPKANYHRVRPVYQYSFEATNIKRPNSKFKPSPQIHVPPEDFKPVPYNVQIQPAVEIIPSSTPSSTELSNGQYFSTAKQNYQENNEYVVTPSKPILEYSYDVTPNPIHQGYYTKPDEGFFDDNTRHYFNMFGRKLPSSTTVLPPRQRLVQKSRPVPLENDTNVNYIKPRPTTDPVSETFEYNNKPELVKAVEWQPKLNENFQYRPKNPKPPEIVRAVEYRPSIHQEEQRDGSYISYELPGDSGAHFYFLTPQLATQKNQVFYEQTNNRVRRKPND